MVLRTTASPCKNSVEKKSRRYGDACRAVATLRASEPGLIRIKQSRQIKGWAVNDLRWIEAASEVLGTSWAQQGIFAPGISEGTWKRFLTGKVAINSEAFKAYCQVLGVPWEEVIEETESREQEIEKESESGSVLCQSWEDAPDVSVFYGRQTELETIKTWVVQENCRLITLLGMGGIGKTTLSVKVAREITATTSKFEFVFWRSLRNAPSIEDVFTDLLQFLSQQQEIPLLLADKMMRVLHYLRQHRCLLILDNVESVLQAGDRNGRYRKGYEGYGQLLRYVAETQHSSCLILTSREKPYGLTAFEGESLPVRSLQLSGLPEPEGRELFKVKGSFTATQPEWETLISRYAGNPLALKIVASSIHDYFDGNVTSFLKTTQQAPFLFDDIRSLLDQQFQRLTELEKSILYWLAINREAISLTNLQTDFVTTVPAREVLESLNSLQRRSLIEKTGSSFSQQPVVMEYVTLQLIQCICQEIVSQEIHLFSSHALIKAQAKDYIRETQIQLILHPIIQQLLTELGSAEHITNSLTQILSMLRAQPARETGYAAGNTLNLMRYAQIDLTGLDCSELTVWQAYLQGIALHDISFNYSDVSRCVFTEALGNILSTAFSPDGQLLATCDTDCQVRLWEVSTGELVLICEGHINWVRDVAFSPDGRTLASCGADRTVRVWNVQDGVCIKTLTGHTNEVFAIAFSPDGKLLASGSSDCTVKLWDVWNGTCLHTLSGHNDWIRTVAFSSDLTTLASGSVDQTIKLWDIHQGQCVNTLAEHTAGVSSVAFSPNGKWLASGSRDRTIKLWQLNPGKCCKTYTGHQSGIYSVAFSAEGDFLASGSGDHTIKLWDCQSDQCIKTLYGHTNEVCSVQMNADDQTLVSASLDQTAKVWNWRTGSCLRSLFGHTDWVFPVAFSPNGETLASGSADQTIWIWDWQQQTCLKVLKGHTAAICAIVFLDGTTLASSSRDTTVRVWDIQTGRCVQILQGHTDWVYAVTTGANQIISSSADRTIKLWNWKTGQCVLTLHGHRDQIWSVACSHDGHRIASGSTDQTVRIWDTQTGECLQVLSGHTNRIKSVAFSQDDRTIASVSTDQTIKLWNVETGQCLQTLTGHTNWVFAVAFSADGQFLASASHDQTVRSWDLRTGECLQILTGHNRLVSSVAFHPHTNLLASGSQDQTVRLWDMNTGSTQILIVKRLYEGLKLKGVKGLTQATITTLQTLGAIV